MLWPRRDVIETIVDNKQTLRLSRLAYDHAPVVTVDFTLKILSCAKYFKLCWV